jgi:hypothetical protein
MTSSLPSALEPTPSPTPTPESEEIKRLREEKTRAELEKDIAVAEKAKFDAEFPKPSTSPLAGETKINEGAVIESEMVSYLSMAYAANRLVLKLRDTDQIVIKNLTIYNKADLDLLLNYKATTAQIKILHDEFCKLVPDAAECGGQEGAVRTLGTPLGIVASFLGSFIDMTALLRTNVTIQGHTFDINEASLVSEVFRAARANDGLCVIKVGAVCNQKPNLYYPAAFPPFDTSLQSELLGTLEELNDLKAKVLAKMESLEDSLKAIARTKNEIGRLKAFIRDGPQQILNAKAALKILEELQAEEAQHRRGLPFEALERMKQLRATIIKLTVDLGTAPADLAAAEALLASQEDGVDEAERREMLAKMRLINDRFDQLIATLIKTDSATGINSLTAYIRAENLQAVMNDPKNSYWLQLAVVKAGGNNRIKTNLLVDIFTGGSRLSHSGGVVVQYNLYDMNGKSVLSDTLTEYTGYIKADKIKKLTNPDAAGDSPRRNFTHP